VSELPAPRYMESMTTVYVHPDAQMTVPSTGDTSLEWVLRYGTTDRPVALAAASCLESYMYLVTECTKDEAWRRIKLMREAIRNTPST